MQPLIDLNLLFEGTYISTEKENRYAKSAPNAKISKAEVSIENPLVVTDDIGLVDLRNKILNRNLVEFTEEDFELYEIPDEPTVDDLNESGVEKLSKLVTKDLKAKGYDSIYFPEGKIQEGELIVFDRKNVKFTDYEQVQGAGKETRKGKGTPKAKGVVRPKAKPVRNAGKSPDAITARTITIYGDPYATSLQYLMDATYHPDLLEAIFGGPSRTTKSGRKDISRERKSRIQFLDKNSPIKTADRLAEILAERYAEENNIDVKDAEQQHDFASIATDIISSYASRNQMVREVLRLNEQQNEEFNFMYNPENIYGEGYNEDIAKEIDGIMDDLPDSYWEGREITDEEFGNLFAEEIEPETKEGKKAEAKEETRIEQSKSRAKDSKDAQNHSADLSGEAYELEDGTGLIQGFNLMGKLVYSGYKKGKRTRVDIDSYTGDVFTSEELSALKELKKELEASEKAAQTQDPFKQQGRVAKTDSVPENVRKFVEDIAKSLGIDKKIIIITDSDFNEGQYQKHGLYGTLAQVRSAKQSASNPYEYGSKRYMSDADAFYIYYDGKLRGDQLFTVVTL